MFIETSAIVAILAGEADGRRFAALIEASGVRFTGAHVRLEASIAISRALGLALSDAHGLYSDFLAGAAIEVLPITDEISRRAVIAFDRFGKGRGHAAQLNFGDCLSYACADQHRLPILFKGNDFIHTDLKAVAA